MNKLQKYFIVLYLDYVNNYLTISKISEHYGISENIMNDIIYEGSKLYKIINKKI